MKGTITGFLCLTILVTGITMFTQKASAEMKKALLVVSFGTSFADTRKITIEAVEQKVQETFRDYEMRRVFTSNIIIDILRERDGIEVDTPEQALQKLKEEGFSEVIVQPLHVIPGAEFHDLLMIIRKFDGAFEKLTVGKPLLATTDDYMKVAEALKDQIPELKEHDAVVLMGHGTHHPANASYGALERVFEDTDLENVFVGTVEGYPELDHVIKKLKQHHVEKVTLMPFMFVAGDHAQNDMAGDEEDSWKMILKNEGFVVDTILKGLGENPKIQAIYTQHIRDAIEGTGAHH